MTTSLPPTRLQRLLGFGVWAALACAALVHLAYVGSIAGLEDDTEHQETTLTLATATQLRLGPGALYGPYSRHNPWVLVQAPLYYHLTALLAWPLTWAGFNPLRACFLAGRGISALASLGCLAVVYRLARADGASWRAGVWAALLVASARVVGNYAVTVRADMLGVLLQTFGVLGVIRALIDRPDRPGGLGASYAAFALAFCVKQHDVVTAAVSSILLLAAAIRKPGWRSPVLRAHLCAALVVAVVLGLDELITTGRMSQMAFVQPMELGRIARSSWLSVLGLVLETGDRSSGLLLLAIACVWALLGSKPLRRLDALLLAYLAAEITGCVALGLNSTGAWVNYAIQAVVFGCLLIGRALDRALAERRPAWRAVPIVLAAVFLAWNVVWATYRAVEERFALVNSLHGLVTSRQMDGVLRTEIYFVALPQYNRLFGRVDLAIDDWLYGCLEQTSATEPRSLWLRQVLTAGPVRFVIVPRNPPIPIPNLEVVPGLTEPLPALGYFPVGQFGQFRLWARPNGGSRMLREGRPGLINPEPASAGAR
ncbi:MAG TPA: hypothetical protein VGZ22_13105 [Isosphaeraceae bacterium]|jgi:hypothetical protein|nr:hypothetical protein [Isosphaeraceae bacterium]